MGNIVPKIRDVDVGRYYPSVLAPSKEFQSIANAENPEVEKLWQVIWKQFTNTFVYDLDEDGATRWEQMLNLYPAVGTSLENRRKDILSKINSLLPYTYRKLQEMLDSIYGADKVKVNLNYNKYGLWLDVAGPLILKSLSMREFTRVIAPANLTMNVSNTIKLDFELNYGGVIRQTKHISIYPSGKFSVEIPNTSYAVTGAVRQAKYYIIRS